MAGPLQEAWDWISQEYSPSALAKNLSPSENPGEKGKLNPDVPSPEDVGKGIVKGARDAAKGLWTGGKDKPASDNNDTLDMGGKDYKFSAVSDPEGTIDNYTETAPTGDQAMKQMGMVDQGGLLQAQTDPKTMSAKQYDALTKEASKGNKLAQQILVSGHYKAHDYPSLSQDLKTIDDPFVNALSGLPSLAENEQANANKVTQPYDFSNAEAQVNNLLGQMGSSQQMTTSPETNSYLNTLQGMVNQGSNNLKDRKS